MLVFELLKAGDEAGEVKRLSLRLVQSLAQFAKDGKVRFFLAEPPDGGADPLAALKFEAGSSGGVGKDAFRALHPLGSGTFKKVETGHTDTFELKPDEAGSVYLLDRIKAGGDDPDRRRAGGRGGRGDLLWAGGRSSRGSCAAEH